MIGVRYSWVSDCDANMELKVMSKNVWFQKAVIVTTEQEADTYRANVAGLFVSRNYEYFLVNHVVILPKVIDESM